jgi:hypothetical protein
MGHKYYEPICGNFAFHCEYFRAERDVNRGASIEVIDLVEWTGRAWVPATRADVFGIARDYDLPIDGLSRDEVVDLLSERRGAREVAA